MEPLSAARRVARFGLFEVDFAAQELRKSGIKIKVQDQPFQILALLLERPGEIVTREEIQKRLWTGDTFVDFDLGLNSAIKKLRQALGDESDNPRFVETLYRRGYRFLAPVQGDEPDAIPSPLIAPLGLENGNGRQAPSGNKQIVKRGTPLFAASLAAKRIRLFLLLLCLGIGFWVGYVLRPRSAPRVTAYQQITEDGRQKREIASDGERLYLQEYESAHSVIGQVFAAGGETSLLQTPFVNPVLGSIAPDGSALFVGQYHEMNKSAPLWSLPLPAGAPRRVGDVLVESMVVSPDGKSLIFSDANAVYEAGTGGGSIHKLFSTNAPAWHLAVSPDGQKFCFEVADVRAGTSRIWEANRDGSNLHLVFPAAENPLHDSAARWTPDGKYLVFQRYREGHENIWVLPERGTWLGSKPRAVQLTNGPLDFGFPLPSRDGKKIFVVGAHPRTQLMRYDDLAGFQPYLGGLSATDLAFSADGQWVTYVSVPDNALWKSRVDGSERVQLTDPAKVRAALPRWSPDTQRIVFMGRTEDTNWRAYLISANGGAFEDLVPGASAGLDPNWMPDGKSIVLSLSNHMGMTGRGVSLVDLERREVHDLPGADHLFSPRVSPDGKFIAALDTESMTLMLFDVVAQKWTELLKSPVGYPSWSHDGQYLYFDSKYSRDPALSRIRLADRKVERLADLSGIPRFWGQLAQWTGLGPGDSLLLTRDASNEEIYAIDWLPN